MKTHCAVFRYYKRLAERAMEQVTDEQLNVAIDKEANSIAVIMKHMTGNMRSRWTDFLTTDGEKPDRDRDSEFVEPPATRESLMAMWEDGWNCVFSAIEPLTDADLGRTVTIRGEAHSVMQAINRQLAHYPHHVGQIVSSGEAFCLRPLAVAQRAAQQIGRIQSQSGSRGSEPALTAGEPEHDGCSARPCKMLRMETIQYNLPQSHIPQAWYNILPDLPKPLAPPLHPGTLQPIGPDDLAPLFPMGLIMQEVSAEREIEIPGEVRQIYAQWRPSPLMRARRLEKALDTPARIYYKYEGVSPAGSHKLNTAVPQAYYNKREGVRNLATETGAGQWGSALSMACAFLGLHCKVFMVRVSYDQKPYRRALIEAFGAIGHRQPEH